MKPRILITREVFTETLDLLSQHFEVTSNQSDGVFTPDELAAQLADKQGALTTLTDRIDALLLERCPGVKALCNIAVGYNNIDIAACSARKVMVTNTPGVLDDSTADFAWALMLACARRITEAEAWLRRGEWQGWKLKQFLGRDVHHATLGIVGMGRIGQAVAKRARGFDMTVLYHNRKRVDETIERELNARYVALDELLARADFVMLQVPYSRETHHLIGAKEIARMKSTAILVNVARGGVVDDAALIHALQQRQIAGAGLDVYEGEPKLNPGFLDLANVVLAPHIASSTEATRREMAMTAARNLVAALTQGRPLNWVNPW
ncbi:MAG TPA: D-glycerate dehydrogenase [Burkholderiales bacterium]|nr:D-glycerate dehydrogenase [Burkholderiales bacterium]